MSSSDPREDLSPIDALYYKAALEGDAGRVAACLKCGGDIRTTYTNNLLAVVVDRGHLDVVRVLLDAGARVNAIDEKCKMTPFLTAAMQGRLAIAKLFVQRGANRYAVAFDGADALMLAAGQGHLDLVHFLLQIGLDFNARCSQGRTALMHAAHRGRVDIVEALLEAGADPAIVDKEGKTALYFARRGGQRAVVERLNQATARDREMSANNHRQERTARHAEHGFAAVVRRLRGQR